MNKVLAFSFVLLLVGTLINADLNVNEDKESTDWLKTIGSSLQSGAEKVQEGAKKFGEELSDGAKKFGENAKKFGSDVKSKFGEWKDKLTDQPTTEANILAKVEKEILNVGKKCDNGYILDTLEGCKQI